MMRFSQQEFRDEYRYSIIMTQYKRMLDRGMITESDYQALNRKYKEKYHPVTDGIIAEYSGAAEPPVRCGLSHLSGAC